MTSAIKSLLIVVLYCICLCQAAAVCGCILTQDFVAHPYAKNYESSQHFALHNFKFPLTFTVLFLDRQLPISNFVFSTFLILLSSLLCTLLYQSLGQNAQDCTEILRGSHSAVNSDTLSNSSSCVNNYRIRSKNSSPLVQRKFRLLRQLELE